MKSNVNKALYKVIKIASTILIVLLVVYGTVRASMITYDFGYRVFTEEAMEKEPGTDITITIKKNMDASDIAEYLEKEGLIRDAALFRLQYELSAYRGKIVPGEYTLNTSMTPKEMMVIMGEEKKDDTQTSENTES